jgi:hypothetical protein
MLDRGIEFRIGFLLRSDDVNSEEEGGYAKKVTSCHVISTTGLRETA